MSDCIRSRLTYSNVLASIALFVALGGGAYAAATVGPEDIEDGAVRSNHIANNAVLSSKVADLGFQKLELINGWRTATELGSRAPAFAVDAQGVVHLRGAMENPGCDLVCNAFDPPAGISPTSTIRVPVATAFSLESGDAESLIISSNHAVTTCGEATGGPCDLTSLDGITYVP